MSSPTDADPLEQHLDEIIASYLDGLALGQLPNRQELLAVHPELAADLEKFFESQDQFDRLASPLRQIGAVPPSVTPQRSGFLGASTRPDPAPLDEIPNTLAFEPPLLPPGAIFPGPVVAGYEILEEIGRGGMGVVFKARQLRLKRLVALKMMLAGSGATTGELARFRAEAEAVAQLKHPNIVQIHEVGEQAGLPFFCLELVEGGSLQRRLIGAPLQAKPAAALVETLARTMQHAHDCGIVHRDLKPANILLTGSLDVPVEQCVPKITDFGLAKRLDSDTGDTRSGDIVGTPGYMAPEQARGQSKSAGPSADIYALGTILYECLTGRTPFKAATPLDTVLQVLFDDPLPVSQLQPSCPRDLETICLKCLHKEPRKRYASAAALGEDLHRFLAGKPIEARPSVWWERARKWVKRKPAVAASVAFLALALAGIVTGGLLYLGQRANVAEKELEVAEKELAARDLSDARQREARLLLDKAQEAYAGGHLDVAQSHLAGARAAIHSETGQEELTRAVDGLLARVDDRIAEKTKREQAAAKKASFANLKNKAEFLLYSPLVTGIDVADNVAARETAEAALALFQVASDKEAGPVLDDCYSDTDRKQIVLGCFELRLIVAEARTRFGRNAVHQALAILELSHRGLPRTRIYHSRKARYLKLQGDEAGAEKERASAEALQPASPLEALLVGIDHLLEEKRPRDALRSFERALDGQNDLFWAHYFLATIRLQAQQPAEAKSHLRECIRQRPEFIWSYLLLGYLHGELDEFKQAEKVFADAWPLVNDKVERYIIYANQGMMKIRRHQYDEAIADLQRANALKPDLFHAYLNLATAYQQQKKWDEALHQLNLAVERKPALALLYRQRAQVHLQRRNLGTRGFLLTPVSQLLVRACQEAAREDFQQAIKHEPRGKDTHKDHLECGLLHYQSKKYAEALRACDASLQRLRTLAAEHRMRVQGVAASVQPEELERDFGRAYRLRGETLLELARVESTEAKYKPLYQEALRSFDNYLGYGPRVAEVFQARAIACTALQDYPAVVREYVQATTVKRNDPTLHAALGWAYLVNDAAKPADHSFTEAIRLDRRNADAHNGRGFARVKLGQHAEGVRDARTALVLGQPNPTPRLFFNAARVFAQAAVTLGPGTNPSPRGGWEMNEVYRNEAVGYLERALALLDNDQQRMAFWQKYVRPDSTRSGALHPLWTSPRFTTLAAQYEPPVQRNAEQQPLR